MVGCRMLLRARTGLRVVVFTMCVCHVRTLVAFDSLCLIKPYQIVQASRRIEMYE